MSKEEKKYWLSLEQWKDEKSFQEQAQREFVNPPFSGTFDRREFLKLMGASLALTSLGCLRRPAETIVPYAHRPEDIIPGKSNEYASSFFDGGEGFGLVVKTREGRPIKAEGNPHHPMNQGGMSARAHAHVLALYDPERLKTSRRNLFNETRSNKETITAYMDEADPVLVSAFKQGSTAILTDHYPSPSSHEVIDQFFKVFKGQHFTWDPVSLESLASTYKKSMGYKVVPRYRLDKAQMVVSINCDFLGTFLSPTEQSRRFSVSRKPTAEMSQLVVFESLLSLTGSNADERYRIRPSENIQVVLTLIDEVLKVKSSSLKSHLKKLKSQLPAFAHEEVVRKIARKLLKYQGKSIVFAGGGQSEQEENLLVLTNYLNELLNNHNQTIDFNEGYTNWLRSTSSMEDFIQRLNQGKIQNVIIHRTNPLYSYPDSEKLIKALRKAKMIIYTGDRMDETAQVSDYIIPDHHDLEKWFAWEFQRGTLSLQQPTVRPLIQSRSFEDSLMSWAQYDRKRPDLFIGTTSWYEYLKQSVGRKGFSWDTLQMKGFQKKAKSFLSPQFNLSAVGSIRNVSYKKQNFEMVFYTTQGLKDGRLANVSWLQEFPDPVTKICWDNYLCISPKDAQDKGLKEGQVVELTTGGRVVSVPVHIQPGQSDGVMGLALGYGRTHAGRVANKVGINAYPLIHLKKDQIILSGVFGEISATSKKIDLAVVQGHHSMEGRQIVVETTLKKYLENPKSGQHKHKVFSLWSEHKYPREKWAMTIDLNSCTGCGACVVACQSENNIPVVGKKYVTEGREMHWMRVDRYYTGKPENPDGVVHQPVVCMHCDNAPCETVCPVAATVHSDEGTNDMIYNRCIGTRYCSHNCPYKVRRFNWFNYANKKENQSKGALNPDVTVRSRGVMEKCTFCIHRVKSKQAEARLKGESVKDGELQTACQQSCPAQAIVFGNFNDKNSRVRKEFEKARSYALLEELNTKPSVKYQSKIRNSDLAKYNQEEEHH